MIQIKRHLLTKLLEWKDDPRKRPIILRGARQVGKSYLARHLGTYFKNFIEINFEFEKDKKEIFEKDRDPHRIIRDLEIILQKKIIPGHTLLFLDEIGECPDAIITLRYFYEKMPELHVISAGSLIDFVLEDIGMPVGRVSPLYLYPLSFLEFLDCIDHGLLKDELLGHDERHEFREVFHQKCLNLLGIYMATGGMPEAVSVWKETEDIMKCSDVHRELIGTYQQDFSKYSKKQQEKYVEIVFNAIPRMLTKKFVFSSVSSEYQSRELKPALFLLEKAKVAHVIHHTSANGLPLGAEVNPALLKVIFLDVALMQSLLGIEYGHWIVDPVKSMVNLGAVTENFVGQEILAYSNPTMPAKLYYWARESRGSSAEVDYVTQIRDDVIPLEVKSGVTGSLKSLHIFMNAKKSPYGIHLSQKNFSSHEKVKRYPLYAVAKLFK